MKRIMLKTCGAALTFICVIGAGPRINSSALDTTMALWLKISSDITDYSTHAVIPKHFSYGVLTDNHSGVPHSALSFTDRTHFEIQNKPHYHAQKLTLSSWVFLDARSFDQKIIALNLDGKMSDSYNLGIYSDNKAEFWIFDKGWHGVRSISTSRVLKTGVWYLITGTYDGETIKVYVNGKLDREVTVGSIDISYNNSAPLYIGYSPTANRLAGKVDDLRIYTKALTAAEIVEIYQTR